MHGLKVSHIVWLQKTLPSNGLRLYVLACIVKWLLLYVQALIPKIWHIAIHTSKDIIYFNKRDWENKMKDGLKTMVDAGKIKETVEGSESAKNICECGRTSFIIKLNGLRPITVFR